MAGKCFQPDYTIVVKMVRHMSLENYTFLGFLLLYVKFRFVKISTTVIKVTSKSLICSIIDVSRSFTQENRKNRKFIFKNPILPDLISCIGDLLMINYQG